MLTSNKMSQSKQGYDKVDYIKEAKRLLRKSEKKLERSKLLNDYLEGFYGTKNKPSEELDA